MPIVCAYDEQLPCRGADSEQVLNTVAALARAGADIDLLCAQPFDNVRSESELKEHYGVEGPFGIDQLPATAFGRRPGVKLGHAWRIAKDDRTSGALVYTRSLPTVAAAVAMGRTVLYETYRPWPRQFPLTRPAIRKLLSHRRVLGVIMHSNHAAEAFIEAGVPTDKIAVVHNGWDPARMRPILSKAAARERLALADRYTVVYTGRVAPEKGLGMVLEIARICDEIEFVIVGSQGHGPVERSGASLRNVRFVPWQPYKRTTSYLYAADVLIIPPTTGPLERIGTTVLPLKLFPYLAAGRVILAPAAPDVEELLGHNENAVLTKADDVAEAAAALRAIASDPLRAERIAEQARRDASSLTWDARAGRILDFLEAISREAGVTGSNVGPRPSVQRG